MDNPTFDTEGEPAMKTSTRGTRLAVAIAGFALLCCAATLGAASGTLQNRLVTFADAPTRLLTFTVNTGLGNGEATSLLLDFVADGNGSIAPADPFPAPGSVTFELKYNGMTITPDNAMFPFNFTAQQAAAGYTAVSTSGKVSLQANRSGTGRYTLTLTFPSGASTLTNNWALSLGGLPAAPVVRGSAYVDQGTFVGLSDAAQCGTGGATPCPSVCPPGEHCASDYGPRLPHWFEEVVILKWPPFPPVPDCPVCGMWNTPIPEGYRRVMVSATPAAKGGELLGPGRAGDVGFSIKDGTAIGRVVDAGGGEYLQMVQYRNGTPPTVSVAALGVSSPEMIAGYATSGGGRSADR